LEGSTYLQSTYDIPAAGTKIYFSNNKLHKNEVAANEAEQSKYRLTLSQQEQTSTPQLVRPNVYVMLVYGRLARVERNQRTQKARSSCA